jgi:hypothetical protein
MFFQLDAAVLRTYLLQLRSGCFKQQTCGLHRLLVKRNKLSLLLGLRSTWCVLALWWCIV